MQCAKTDYFPIKLSRRLPLVNAADTAYTHFFCSFYPPSLGGGAYSTGLILEPSDSPRGRGSRLGALRELRPEDVLEPHGRLADRPAVEREGEDDEGRGVAADPEVHLG